MKIQYVGWLSTDNLGDIALYQAIKRLFQPYSVDASIPDPDAVMIGGGTLLFRSTFLEDVRRAVEASQHSFTFGTGVAHPDFVEVFRPDSWKSALDRCFYVGVRGPDSLQLLRDHGFSGPVEVIGDPALLLRQESAKAQNSGRRSVAINICNPRRARSWGFDNERVRISVVQAATQLIQSGCLLTFISLDSRSDRYIQSAVSEICSPDRIAFVAGYKSLEHTLDTLASAHLVIGEKLHATVLAAAAGTPFVSLAYQPKCSDFAKSLGMEELLIPLGRVTAADILARIEYVEEHRAEIIDRMLANVSFYREKLHGAASTVKGYLEEVRSGAERVLRASAREHE